jgi:hypothetical protein
MYGGEANMSGGLALVVERPGRVIEPMERVLPERPLTVREMLGQSMPTPGLTPDVFRWRAANMPLYLRSLRKVAAARAVGAVVIYGSLYLEVIREDGLRLDLGLVGHKVVTTAGVTKTVDFLRANDVTTGTNFKFHGIGTGSTAEAAGDTTLVTELTTEYAPDNTRPTGSQTNNGATVYRTVGTVTVDATPGAAIREHGVFSAATAGTLLDRTVFAAITLSSGDSIAATYDLTVAAGG